MIPDDTTLLDLAFGARNGSRLRYLWDGGSDGDDSVADLALCSHLAFYVQDPTQLDRLWLSSPRGARSKTQRRRDYRDRTIRKALTGCRDTFDWEQWARGQNVAPMVFTKPSPAPKVAPDPEPPRTLPPADEILDLWDRCLSLQESIEGQAWFARRWTSGGGRLCQRSLEADACRVLPVGAVCPAWARFGKPWPQTPYRLIAPLWGALGRLVSLRARWISREPPTDGRKAVAPKGHTVRGGIMANAVGRALLQLGHKPPWAPVLPDVWIVEGESDHLAYAGQFDHEDDSAPAIFGMVSGSWISEIATRIPDGAIVVIATDDDSAGEAYAKRIAETFGGRDVDLRRYRGKGLNHAQG